jgi:hypothetical protein
MQCEGSGLQGDETTKERDSFGGMGETNECDAARAFHARRKEWDGEIWVRLKTEDDSIFP